MNFLFNLKDPEGKYSPTSAATSPLEKDKNVLYVAFQSGLIMRYNIETNEMKPFFNITKEIKAMREAAEVNKYKKGPFSHYRYPKDFTMLGDERGLLGLAFHPDKERKGEFFIFYSAATDKEHMTGTAFALDNYAVLERVDPVANTRTQMMRIPQPQWNHNGGMLMFGPQDGYLYIGLGDGGGFNDEHGRLAKPSRDQSKYKRNVAYFNDKESKDKRGVILLSEKDPKSYLGYAQDPTVPYGKILRIDVNQNNHGFPPVIGKGYSIPKGNPFLRHKTQNVSFGRICKYFQGHQPLPEIYTYGLRNPWKFDISQRGDHIFVGDVGQSETEEITLITKPGENHGWRAMEANRVFNLSLLVQLENDTFYHRKIVPPILTYGRDVGRAVIGGYLIDYGTSLWLEFDQRFPYPTVMPVGFHQGRFYVFGDWTGKIMVGIEEVQEWGIKRWRWQKIYEFTDRDIHSFAKDKQGRIYVLHKTSVFAKTSEKTFGISRLQDLLIPITTTATMKKSSLSFDISSGSSSEEEEAVETKLTSDFKASQSYFERRGAFARYSYKEKLEEDEIKRILTEVVVVASRTKSALRKTEKGNAAFAKIHVTILKIEDMHQELTTENSVCPAYTAQTKPDMHDIPWLGSFKIARGKAFSSLAFSSNQNRITTGDLHAASQPDQSLWGIGHTNTENGIVTFPGGIPIYKNGKLVAGLGVSGDSSSIDHIIATTAMRNLGVPYQIPAHLITPTSPSSSSSLGTTTKSMFRFPVFGRKPKASQMLILAETMVSINHRCTPMGEQPEQYPASLGNTPDRKIINFEYILWHHIHLTVKYVVASFLKDDPKKKEMVKELVRQFKEWGEGFLFSDNIKSQSDKPFELINFWEQELIRTHTLAAKAIADNSWEVKNYSEKLKGLLVIMGQNRIQIGEFLTKLAGRETKTLWDAHLICTSDYISALQTTRDLNGSAFGKAVFTCKLLGLELGGLLNEKIHGRTTCNKKK